MEAALEQTVRKLKARLEEAMGAPIQLTLFGSRARGDAVEGSDVDLFVVVPKLDRQTMDTLLDIAWEVGFEAGWVLSLIPVAEEELPRLSESPFVRSVEQEGIRL